MLPTHAILTPVSDWIRNHKAGIAAFICAGLVAIVPESWKPLVTAAGTLFASHAVSTSASTKSVEAHLRRRGIY